MKFDILTDCGNGYRIKETYNFPVKTIKGATKHAQKMLDDFNLEEKRRYGDTAVCRTLISVDFAKESERGE